jgi:hypothetical protein
VLTNLRRVAVATIYGLTAFKILEAIIVDKDRIQGSAELAKGKMKEVVGKVTGDSKLEGEGKADQFNLYRLTLVDERMVAATTV